MSDSFDRRTLYAFARRVAGKPANGEIDAAPESMRPFLRNLVELSQADVQNALTTAYLARGLDPDALSDDLADIDPDGPVPDDQTELARPRYRMRRAADITAEPLEWLWEPRVPLGMLTLFAGDPKLGKSFVTLGLAASVSRGAGLPGSPSRPVSGSVVLLSAEDDPSRTIVPRLNAAGADMAKVHLLESVILTDGAEALPSLRVDIDALETAVAALGDCKLVVIDPVSAYLGGSDDHKNSELRGVLSPLKRVAERTGAAIVLVTHLNKGSGTNGKHRVTGSIAYVGACRANFLFVRDREEAAAGRRVLMLDNGCNLADSVPTLAYRIEDRGDGPAVEWEAEPVDITAERALAAEGEDAEDRAERRECDDWLRDVLKAGRRLQTELQTEGRDAGFSLDQLKRAKQRIGAETHRDGFGKGSKCYWTTTGRPAPGPPDEPTERT